MLKSKRTLAMVLAIVASLALTTYGTLAFLTDSDTVVNTFTVGNVDITVDETPVGPDGEPVEGERVEANEYHLMPGHTYVKDPTTTVHAGSEEAYVRMVVTIDKLNELKAIAALGGANFTLDKLVNGLDSSVWVPVPEATVEDTTANTVTYEFRYYTTVDATEATEDMVLPPLFTEIKIPGEVTGDELATLADMQITVNGHAIQAESFADANEAWAAFDAQVSTAATTTITDDDLTLVPGDGRITLAGEED